LVTHTNPDATLLVDFPAATVVTSDSAAAMPSNVELRMSSDNANKFWLGKLNFTLAMAQRRAKRNGKRPVALKLLPFTKTATASAS
jgi:hypothetical protein